MKNKIQFIIFCFLILSTSTVFATTDSYIPGEPRVNATRLTNDGGTYRLFTGFEFKTYTPSKIGLDVCIENEYKYIKEADALDNFTDKYSVVGSSQGGLRVLAYAAYLKNNDPAEYQRLQAVITVSGIDKGLKALDGGFSAVYRRVHNDASIIRDGFKGVTEAVPGAAVFKVMSDFFSALPFTPNNRFPSTSDWMNAIVEMLPDNFKCYIKPALKAGKFCAFPFINCTDNIKKANSIAEIRDMIPRSNFIKNYVSDSTKHIKKVKVGTKKIWKLVTKKKIKIFGKTRRIKVMVKRTVNVYKYYTYYEDIPKFDKDMPIGYIVGSNSNTLSMTNKEDEYRKYIEDARVLFRKAYNIHSHTKWIPFIGWVMNSSKNAKRCKKAMNWMANFDGELNKLKGSSANDGLVAVSSQFYPQTFTDPNTGKVREVHQKVLAYDPKTKKSYVELPEYNHLTITSKSNEKVQSIVESMMIEAEGL